MILGPICRENRRFADGQAVRPGQSAVGRRAGFRISARELPARRRRGRPQRTESPTAGPRLGRRPPVCGWASGPRLGDLERAGPRRERFRGWVLASGGAEQDLPRGSDAKEDGASRTWTFWSCPPGRWWVSQPPEHPAGRWCCARAKVFGHLSAGGERAAGSAAAKACEEIKIAAGDASRAGRLRCLGGVRRTTPGATAESLADA